MPTSPNKTFSNARLDPAYDAEDALTIPVKLAASSTFAKGTVLGEVLGTNELQKVSFGGTVSGGTFTLTFNAQTTAAIAWNATAEEVSAALMLLSTIGQGNVRVTGGAAPNYYNVEFIGTLAGADQAQMTANGGSLTGSSPTIAVATTRGGAAGTPGTFKAYSNANTDGSQQARVILQYACTTDASSNVTMDGEHGDTQKVAPVYIAGTFRTEDLTGLDEAAIRGLGRMIQGTVTSGLLRIG